MNTHIRREADIKTKNTAHSSGGNPLFSLFWKCAFFITLLFASAACVVFFSLHTSLKTDAEIKARLSTNALNQNTALMAGALFNGTKEAAQYFVNMLDTRNTVTERNIFVYTFYKANPHIAGIVIHKKNTPISSAQKILNPDIMSARIFDYASFDDFLNSAGTALNEASLFGGILPAREAFNYPVLVCALPETPDVLSYCFFLADGLSAALQTEAVDGGGAALVGQKGAVLLSSQENSGEKSALLRGETIAPSLRTALAKAVSANARGAGARGSGASGRIAGETETGFSFIFSETGGGRYQVFCRNTAQETRLIHYYPADAPFRDTQTIFIRCAFLSLAVLLSAFAALRLLSKSTLLPLARLDEAAKEAAALNFDTEIKRISHDEIGRLSFHTARMLSALKTHAAFGSTAIARAFIQNEIQEGITKKSAVIMCAGIANLSVLKQKLGTTELSSYISKFITIVHECAAKTKGTAEYFSGGFILCHWGAAFGTGNKSHDTLNAVRSALMMRVAFIEDNRDRKAKNKPLLQASFALDTGVVNAGIAGGRQRKEYVVFGNAARNTKNIALVNRFETADIIASEQIFLRVSKFIIAREIGAAASAASASAAAADAGADGVKRLFAVINLKTEEGVTQPIPRNLDELRRLLDCGGEDSDASG